MSYYTIVNDPDEEYFIVGDIHGCLEQLMDNYAEWCLKHVQHPKMKLVFIGDYLDRGSNVGIIDYMKTILEGENAKDIVFICGNHEVFKYVNTLVSKYDPTNLYTSRLKFYEDQGIKLCYAYINIAKHLIISHAGMNLNIIGNSIEDIDKHCSNILASLDVIEHFTIDGITSLTLSEQECKIHDNTFYPLVETFEDISPKTISKYTDSTKWTQIFGHYHSTFILSDAKILFQIEMAHFADHDQIKFICIDSSDEKYFVTHFELYANNRYNWFSHKVNK